MGIVTYFLPEIDEFHSVKDAQKKHAARCKLSSSSHNYMESPGDVKLTLFSERSIPVFYVLMLRACFFIIHTFKSNIRSFFFFFLQIVCVRMWDIYTKTQLSRHAAAVELLLARHMLRRITSR